MSDTCKLEQRIVRHSPSTDAGSPEVWGIYEPDTGSIQYICADPVTRQAALIDVVLNFDPTRFTTHTGSMDQILELVNEKGLDVTWVLDTHPHADHLMASSRLKERTGAQNAIGEKVKGSRSFGVASTTYPMLLIRSKILTICLPMATLSNWASLRCV